MAMTRHLMFALLAMTAGTAAGQGKQLQYCPMEPAHLEFRVPKKALTWLAGETFSGACDDVPGTVWMKVPSKAFDVWVHADGPSGSGRFWILTVGVGPARAAKPDRGFCLSTSTVGWRTLQRFGEAPLPWVGDSDKDGNAELVIWDSFPLSEDPSMAEYGLVAWVYEMNSRGVFRIDWNLSRRMAERIAAAYREPLEEAPGLQVLRRKASEALEAFAREGCRIRPSSAR